MTADGNVNIIDAQQIARFSVALSAAARVNTTLLTPAPLNTLGLSQSAATVGVGSSIQLAPVPADASSNALNGCYPTTFTSSAPAIATVDSTGRVVGVAEGSATITATSSGKTAQAAITVGSVAASMTVVQG